jgi:hypothetical protein
MLFTAAEMRNSWRTSVTSTGILKRYHVRAEASRRSTSTGRPTRRACAVSRPRPCPLESGRRSARLRQRQHSQPIEGVSEDRRKLARSAASPGTVAETAGMEAGEQAGVGRCVRLPRSQGNSAQRTLAVFTAHLVRIFMPPGSMVKGVFSSMSIPRTRRYAV